MAESVWVFTQHLPPTSSSTNRAPVLQGLLVREDSPVPISEMSPIRRSQSRNPIPLAKDWFRDGQVRETLANGFLTLIRRFPHCYSSRSSWDYTGLCALGRKAKVNAEMLRMDKGTRRNTS